MRDVANITQVDSDYQEYLDFGFHVLANLDKYYEQGDVLAKQQMIGLIYPEKLIFENNQCRTNKQREVIEYITRTVKELEGNKNGTDKNFSYQSPMVQFITSGKKLFHELYKGLAPFTFLLLS